MPLPIANDPAVNQIARAIVEGNSLSRLITDNAANDPMMAKENDNRTSQAS
jgi:hypothetical protein